MGLINNILRNIFGNNSNNRPQEDIDFESQVRSNGYEYAGKRIAHIINEKIYSKTLAKQFVLEELDAARQGNHFSKNFVKNSGFKVHEYHGVMSKTSWEGSVSDLENLQLFLRFFLLKISDTKLMTQLVLSVLDEIMKIWGLGKYEALDNDLEKFHNVEVWLDYNTNLVWQLDIENKLFSWDEANNYVAKINKNKYGGFNNWRLPTIEEWEYVCKYKNLNIAWKYKEKNINITDFLFEFYWSSTLDVDYDKAWNIHIINGTAGRDNRDDKQCVRLVRNIENK